METKRKFKEKTFTVSPEHPFVMIGECINLTRREKLAATNEQGDFSMVRENVL